MAISAAEREELHGLVQEQLGDRGAALLMAGLASADLDAMEERLTLRIDLTRAELRTEMAELRGEFGELRGQFGELRGEFGELRGEFGTLKGTVGEELGKIRAEIGSQNRLLFFAMLTSVIGIAALVFSAIQLAGD